MTDDRWQSMSARSLIARASRQTERMHAGFERHVDLLIEGDPALAGVVATHGRPQPFDRSPTFETLVLLILEQQVSLDSARAAFDRLARAVQIRPEEILAMSDEHLRDVGFSRQKARYARELSRWVTDGRLDLGGLATLDDAEVRTTMTRVPGIGPWTADVFLMSALGRADIWPSGDRALAVATAEALELGDPPARADLEEIGERWRPYRSAAAQILWHGYLRRRRRRIPPNRYDPVG